jgi:hypothetical protein
MEKPPSYNDGAEPASLEKKIGGGEELAPHDSLAGSGSMHSGEDILSMQDLDPALNMKMHLVNNVSDD